MPATRRARAAAAEREAKRRAAHEISVERTRLVGKLDVGVLSVIAGFGGKRELWGVALAFKEHGVEEVVDPRAVEYALRVAVLDADDANLRAITGMLVPNI